MTPCECIARINAKFKENGYFQRIATAWIFTPTYKGDGLTIGVEPTSEAPKRYKLTTVMASHCPFCGQKYEDRDEVKAATNDNLPSTNEAI